MQNNLKTINDLKITKGTKVLIRLDLNVPTNEEGDIIDDFRIQESLPTLKELSQQGAKIIVLAHKEKGSLEKVVAYVIGKLAQDGITGKFAKDVLNQDGVDTKESNDYKMLSEQADGEIIFLENIRTCLKEKHEDEKERDEFGQQLATLGEVYINEAFSASHRGHASITSIPKFLPSALGPQMINEIEKLSLALTPVHPSLLIVGGAKFDTKLPMIEKFLDVVDTIFIGGALAHTFWRMKGQEIGTSLIDDQVKISPEVLNSSKIFLPIDIMNQDKQNKKLDEVTKLDKITDFGQDTFAELLNILDVTKTVIWNGPLDYYEAGYDWGTRSLIETLSKMTDKTIILGGGDTVTEINKVKETDPNIHFTHVSTGGGAMIDFLSAGTLPGIEAVTNSTHSRM